MVTSVARPGATAFALVMLCLAAVCPRQAYAQAEPDSAKKMQQIAVAAGTKIMQCCSSFSLGSAEVTIDFLSPKTYYNVKADKTEMYLTIQWKGTFSDRTFRITGILTSRLNGCDATWKPLAHSKGVLSGCSRGCLNVLDCYGH